MKNILIILLLTPFYSFSQNVKTDEYFIDGKKVIKYFWNEGEYNKTLIEVVNDKSSTYTNYTSSEGIEVGTFFSISKDYGKYFKVDVSIVNNTDKRIDFDPNSIEILLINKSDEKNKSFVISFEDYNKKIVRRQKSNTFWTAFSTGLSNGMAGTTYSNSNSYYNGTNGFGSLSTTTTSYSPSLASMQYQQNQKLLTDLDMEQQKKMSYINDGYLKKNTIFPNTTLIGYLLIPFDKKVTKMDFLMKIGKKLFSFNNAYRKD